MPGRSYVVQLPTMTQTTSAIDPSTGTVPSWDVSDAVSIVVTNASVTSAPSPKIQIALTSDVNPTWVTLMYNTSAASPMLTSSSIALTITNAAFKQMRVSASAVLSTAGLYNANKLVIV